METSKMDLPECIRKKLKSCRTLPSIPAIAFRILELSRQEDATVHDIAQAISLDPALSAKLLRVSNSALYGIRHEITTVNRAVAVLGINTALSLALSFSLTRNLNQKQFRNFDPVIFWRRSVIAAVAGKVLAKMLCSHSQMEELFLSGLLLDFGMLALNEANPEEYDSLIAAAGGSHSRLIELERERLGTDHALVGAWLLEKWSIPEKYVAAVKASHDPETIVDSDSDRSLFCRATSVAADIAEIWVDPARAVGAARHSALHLLKLPVERFESLIDEVASGIPEITSVLELNIGDDHAIAQLQEQAHEALVVLTMQAQQQVQQIRDLSRRDRLTAVYNRSYLEEELPRQYEKALQCGRPLSVLFIDIDHFKRVNDTYGHEAGDAVLVSTAGKIATATRASDFVARYGGEEFVCLMPNTESQDAAMTAELIRASVESNIIGDDPALQVTVSIGGTTFPGPRPMENPRQLLAEADRCLYIAKAKGRNNLIMAALADEREMRTAGSVKVTA